MNWLVKKLGGAVVAGLGWKLGSDAYDAIKERIKRHTSGSGDAATEEQGPAAQAATQEAATAEGDRPDQGSEGDGR